MPRYLSKEAAAQKAVDSFEEGPELTRSPDRLPPGDLPGILGSEEEEEAAIAALSQRNEKRDELHPYTQSLTLSDLESCVRVEEQTFPPQERCTREKVSLSTVSLDATLSRRHGGEA